MLGFRFVKFQPNDYVLKYKKGKIVREGTGLSFFYYSPTTSLVSVPIGSMEAPFIFEEVTSDFQSLSVQGQVTYRIFDAKKISVLLNYTLDNDDYSYTSDDADKLPQRIITIIRVLLKKQIERLPLREAIKSSESLVKQIMQEIREDPELESLGVEILGFSVVAVLPGQETARALEATAREQILKEADDAIYARRNSSVEQERIIKENELNTEIAVEEKKRQIREAQKNAEMSIQQKDHELKESEMLFRIAQEDKRKSLVDIAAANARTESDSKAYAISASMKALQGVDPSVIQSLAGMGMQPEKLIALAFQGLAEKAEKIGQLNITPDLLKELVGKTGKNG